MSRDLAHRVTELVKPTSKEDKRMTLFPTARREGLIVEELPDEVLVYDLNTDKAHCLNKTAALIWKNCDGKKAEGDIAAVLQRELKSPIPNQVVTLGLEELAGFGLLKEVAAGPRREHLSRRRLIQNLGLTAALALPLIVSISAPAAAQAGSGPPDPCIANPGGLGCSCNIDSQCDSQNCNEGVCGPEL
ncbi:MAG: PqqD family protein [Pyrinomonadaceae bacterium]|nr:PqqD family protein [Pyrinomonadaceae bacterium]